MRLALLAKASVCSGALAFAGLAQAQAVDPAPLPVSPATEASPASPPSASASSGLGEIVVTAQKRSENLQNVPIAVTALSASAVEGMHATTIQGLQGSVPNVQINNFSNTPNSAVFTIRGRCCTNRHAG